MVTQSQHQEQTEPLPAKSRSKTRNSRAFAVALGIFLLLAAMNVCVFLIPRQGKSISGKIDGKIDKNYYRWFASGNWEIDDISEIADILAEVYYLTHGEGIEQFRFTVYDVEKKPLRIRAFSKFVKAIGRLGNKHDVGLAGVDWPSGDIYLRNLGNHQAIAFLELSFHELGHGHPRSRLEPILNSIKWTAANITGNLYEIECPAEANVIDSIVALMYLDPALGYLIFQNYDQTFSSQTGVYAVATNYSLYRCLEGGRVEKYPGLEVLQEKIKEKTAGKTAEQITEQIRQGVLKMFKDRFGNREDFEQKYSLLQKYFKDGMVDISHD